ncbi:hypothetical protein BRE01_23120 [Brevibacillus reuszeri]|uniref:Uncharacterized protein n=1 Tax=Brevibacillus reuszeri TaxID=54915 RepID=A0ABQ0TKZ1_9BACL|nr:hypothetical protein BRE01_23120 [Brevibacillus reuszeri]
MNRNSSTVENFLSHGLFLMIGVAHGEDILLGKEQAGICAWISQTTIHLSRPNLTFPSTVLIYYADNN